MLPPIPPDDLLPSFRETDWHYCRAIAARGDTYLHLPTLRALVGRVIEMGTDGPWETPVAMFPDGGVRVVEFGVRSVVTTASQTEPAVGSAGGWACGPARSSCRSTSARLQLPRQSPQSRTSR